VGPAGEHDRAAVGVEAQYEHSLIVAAEGEVLVLLEVCGVLVGVATRMAPRAPLPPSRRNSAWH